MLCDDSVEGVAWPGPRVLRPPLMIGSMRLARHGAVEPTKASANSGAALLLFDAVQGRAREHCSHRLISCCSTIRGSTIPHYLTSLIGWVERRDANVVG